MAKLKQIWPLEKRFAGQILCLPDAYPGSFGSQLQKLGYFMQCKAYARSTGKPCKAKALKNGKCKCHGGLSTGAKTPEGKERLSIALKKRMADGQMKKAKDGYQVWLAAGGREILSREALRREWLKRLRKKYFRDMYARATSWG